MDRVRHQYADVKPKISQNMVLLILHIKKRTSLIRFQF